MSLQKLATRFGDKRTALSLFLLVELVLRVVPLKYVHAGLRIVVDDFWLHKFAELAACKLVELGRFVELRRVDLARSATAQKGQS